LAEVWPNWKTLESRSWVKSNVWPNPSAEVRHQPNFGPSLSDCMDEAPLSNLFVYRYKSIR